MPLQKLQFRPGLNREGTDYSNEGGWYDGDKIRFRSGFPEKIGGWTRMSNNQFLGTARALWCWQDFDGSHNYVGVGTNVKYYIEYGSTYYDITPIYYSDDPDLSGAFTATSTTLTYSITASSSSITVGSTSLNPAGYIQIGSEKIAYTNNILGVLSGLTRGYGGTTAASHTAGDAVYTDTVIITDAQYNPGAGDYIIISGAVGLGGNITAGVLNQEYVVQHVFSSSTYSIGARTAGTSVDTVSPVIGNVSDTGHGGTAIVIDYLYPSGLDVYSAFGGWGTGPYSRGGWGSGYAGGAGQQLRLWSNDNYGEDLVIAPRNGPIYYWQDAGTVGTRSKSLADLATAAGYDGDFVPNETLAVSASAIQRFIIAMGSNPYDPTDSETAFDPMLVRWSDQENAYQWVPAATNQSGEFRLSNGSYIMTYENTRQEILIWTDSCLYSMQYLGAPYVWGFNVLMDNISIMSPNAAITVNNVTYWMGTDKFYMYSGRVETLPCSLRQYIFEDLNTQQAFQVFSGSNEGYNEVWWFYVSEESTDNTVDKYVIYNYLDRVWYYGTMARTAWLDSGIRPYPMAANYENRILYHESAVDDVSGLTPVAINAYVQSSDFDIGDGHNFGFVWRILPDVNFNGSNVNNPSVTMTVKPRQNSGTPYGTADSPAVTSDNNYSLRNVYTVQEFDGQVYTRLRGRQLAFRIESNNVGTAWQLGTPRIDIRNDGRR